MKILAIKGGGVRGLLAARLGERLEKRVPAWARSADVIAGTSTGGILALGIAVGMTWSELVKLYRDDAKRIFRDSVWRDLANLSISGHALRGAQYPQEGLREVLEEHFGKTRLRELQVDVLIPAFDLDATGADGQRSWRPKFFDRQHDGAERVVDVALATSAAPTYFPSHKGYVDGGVVANDPSVCALAYALRRRPDSIASLMVGGVSLLTLGTGRLPKYVAGEDDKDWGLGQWGRTILDVVMDGGLLAPVFQATSILRDKHHHLDPVLPREIALDGNAWDGNAALEQSLEDLLQVADGASLDESARWLKANGWSK